MNILKKYIKISIFTALLLSNTTFCLAENLTDAFGKKMTDVGTSAGYKDVKSIDPIIGTIIKTFLSLLGIIFLVLMLYGGYLWMTDRGGGKDVDKAKSVIQAAIIGLAIVLGSYAITYFVIERMASQVLIINNGG